MTKPSAADTFQIRSVSLEWLVTRIGSLPDETVNAIAAAIALCVSYRPTW